MRRFLNWLIGLPIALIVAGFAVANRRSVQVSFDPFTQDSPSVFIDMPLWLLLFCGLFLGVIAGWIGCWFAQGKWRKATRECRSDLRRVEEELARLRQAPPAPPATDYA